MNQTFDMSLHRTPRLSEIEQELMRWEEQLEDWAKRIPWTSPEQRKDSMITAKFLRKLVAECWIHTLAAKSRGGDPMDSSAFRARRVYRQISQYGPSLSDNMESRLPESVPNLVAA